MAVMSRIIVPFWFNVWQPAMLSGVTALLSNGKSGGSVKLIVHDSVHCWARGLLSTWWRLKEVGKAWRGRQGLLVM